MWIAATVVVVQGPVGLIAFGVLSPVLSPARFVRA